MSVDSPVGSTMPLMAIGTALFAATVLLRRRSARAGFAAPRARPPSGLWVWPVPVLGDRRPVVSDGWGSDRQAADGTTRPHLGADIMYRRQSRSDLASAYPPGTPNGTAGYFMPEDVPALAAASGIVRQAKRTARGYSVIIRHPGGWATYYTHLENLLVEPGQEVVAGQPLGLIGYDPTDRRRLKHLHFELWRGGTRRGAVDPAPYLAAWQLLALTTWAPPTVRNGGLVYRPVGSRGEPYPDWLRQLKGQSGVYVIRQDGETVYVGESHTGRLYETLTRHFQAWRRWKGFWKGQYAEGHDPGLTYPRDSVEVAVRPTAADDAIDEEARLIQRLRPRDNLLGQPEPDELDEIPF